MPERTGADEAPEARKLPLQWPQTPCRFVYLWKRLLLCRVLLAPPSAWAFA